MAIKLTPGESVADKGPRKYPEGETQEELGWDQDTTE